MQTAKLRARSNDLALGHIACAFDASTGLSHDYVTIQPVAAAVHIGLPVGMSEDARRTSGAKQCIRFAQGLGILHKAARS